jgi:hypothetical protein
MLSAFSKLKTFLLGQSIIESERRRAVRIPCRIKAGLEGMGAPIQVTNISVLGLRAESTQRLRKNVVVQVEGREFPGRPMAARVVWCQGKGEQWTAGLLFVGTKEEKIGSWVATALDRLGATQSKGKERRAHIRISTEGISYLCNRSGDRLCEGHLRNIGLGGALFLSEVEVNPGTPALIQMDIVGRPRLNEECVVRSCRKDSRSQQFFVGLQFSETGSDEVRKFIKQIRR